MLDVEMEVSKLTRRFTDCIDFFQKQLNEKHLTKKGRIELIAFIKRLKKSYSIQEDKK